MKAPMISSVTALILALILVLPAICNCWTPKSDIPQPERVSSSVRLHELILQARQKRRALPLVGVHDALSARIMVRQACSTARDTSDDPFLALFVSGFGVSAARLGVPDAGILTRSEIEDTAKNIIQTTLPLTPNNQTIPVIVDGDTGFGGSPNVRQTIYQMAQLGAAAITIEDQIFPKRCTYVAGSNVNILSRSDAKQRIRTALAAQREVYEQTGNYLSIIARTDCRMSSSGLEEAIERCLIFEELGADIVYAEHLQNRQEYETLRGSMSSSETPMILAQVQQTLPTIEKYDKKPDTNDGNKPYSLQDAAEMGYDMALWGVTGLQAYMAALEETAAELLKPNGDGYLSSSRTTSSTSYQRPLATLDEVKKVVGFDVLDTFDNEYGCN